MPSHPLPRRTAARQRRRENLVQAISRALGWFSAALGIVQLAAPRHLLGAVGIRPSGRRVVVTTRLVGIRELTVVPGLLAVSRPWGWLAARVAGDAVDIALMVAALRSRTTRRGRESSAAISIRPW